MYVKETSEYSVENICKLLIWSESQHETLIKFSPPKHCSTSIFNRHFSIEVATRMRENDVTSLQLNDTKTHNKMSIIRVHTNDVRCIYNKRIKAIIYDIHNCGVKRCLAYLCKRDDSTDLCGQIRAKMKCKLLTH